MSDRPTTLSRLSLGQLAEDTVTGFRGVVTCRVMRLHGGARVELTARAEPGKEPATHWTEAGRVIPVLGTATADTPAPETDQDPAGGV
jgi:hypothetical protein